MPSSPALAARMVAPIPRTGDPFVVELGAGTGAFTVAAQEVLRGRGRHLAVECNPEWAALLADRHPGVEVVQARAHELPALLDRPADVIISGLPWSAYWPEGQRPLIELLAGALGPEGTLTQFSYSWSRWAPPARRQHREFGAAFEELVVSRTVLRNLPPAYVYYARRPRG
ncbi:class I SAM-dependent methyltransferase [Sciscionella sediminilitoris]|uniref:class I SAM-dependent methyltransferase n=1 Tax=Sciscionella sediminilitoris TaxID=1445613 RepID=UPI001E309299|nr:methyltransferase domain-containing protein [Sciscionella sp. SE31]